jgi:hypothetical protein
MKTWKLLFLTIILGLLIYELLQSDIVITRKLKSSDCKIKYKYHLRYNQQEFNNMSARTAKNKLIRCLCEKYYQTRDSSVGDYILDFYKSDYNSRFEYFDNVLQSKPDSLILVQHLTEIFQDDQKLLSAIKNKKTSFDDIYSYMVSQVRLDQHIKSKYFKIKDDLSIIIPPIDSLVKNRLSVFHDL